MSWKRIAGKLGFKPFSSVGLRLDRILASDSYILQKGVVTTDATAGAIAMTAAEILGGLILRDPAGGARADTVPTAATIVAAIKNCKAGDSFEFTIRNTADQAETITVTTATGNTLSGTMTIAQNNSKRFLVVVTTATSGSEAVTTYSLGTVVH